MAPPEPLQELDRTPGGMRSSRSAQELLHGRVNPVRAVKRRVAAVGERRTSAFLVPLQPLVARLPTDAIPGTELRHREEGAPVITEKALALLHGCGLQPRHIHLFEKCASESSMLPILPVNSVTNLPGLHRAAA